MYSKLRCVCVGNLLEGERCQGNTRGGAQKPANPLFGTVCRMLFSSSIFLFLFLPAVLLGVLLLPPALRNPFLLAASLIFYAWGETVYTAIILVSITGNYILVSLMTAITKRRRTATGSLRGQV